MGARNLPLSLFFSQAGLPYLYLQNNDNGDGEEKCQIFDFDSLELWLRKSDEEDESRVR